MMAEELTGPTVGEGSSSQGGDLPPSPDRLFTLDHVDVKQRLDIFLSNQFADYSRSAVQTLIKAGEVLVNGLRAKPSQELRTGDRISIRFPGLQEQAQLIPQAMPLDILYEDEDVLVLNKAPGVVVHPGAGHAEGTLVHGLVAHCRQLARQGAPLRPGIVHRLDRNTSGALVVAKSNAAYLDLIRQFKDRTVQKHYVALVYGSFSQPSGQLTTSLGRHPADRKKIAVQKDKGRLAVTHWSVEKAWGEVSLLRVTIETGRTHQIRVHLSYLTHPIVGDATYGGGKHRVRSLRSEPLRNMLIRVDRQLLHARILAFRHPRTDQLLSFCAPLPDDFAEVLRQLEALFPPPSH
jgi:23S rRNA pseudouridine1911/1915/1917 synthase